MPALISPASRSVFAVTHVREFFDAYCVGDAGGIIDQFRASPIATDCSFVSGWVRKLTADKLHRYADLQPLADADRSYELSLRPGCKVTGTDSIIRKVPKGQVLNVMAPEFVAYFSPRFQQILTRIRAVLRPSVVLAIGYNQAHVGLRWGVSRPAGSI